MKNLLFRNRTFLFVAIILLAIIPLTFQFSIQESETKLLFVFLQDFPKVGLALGLAGVLLALMTHSTFTKRGQLGIVGLFFLAPLTSLSIGEIPPTFIAWDFQPAIGWMYWGTGLVLALLALKKENVVVE
ncbi:MAG: hypothetical protein ACPG49_04660 [Chitinophagales bacterium]